MTVALKSWKALGTSVHVLATDDDGLGPASTAVREVLEDVDGVYSRFREDSELSRLNAGAGRVNRVSPLLATAIDAALRAARLTRGRSIPPSARPFGWRATTTTSRRLPPLAGR